MGLAGSESRARAHASGPDRVARRQRVIFEVVSEEDEKDYVRAILANAKQGSLKAATWLDERMHGKLAETLNINESPAVQEATDDSRRERSAAILGVLAEAGLLKQTIEDGIAAGTVIEGD